VAGANHVEVIGNHFVTSLNQPATAGIARGIYRETAAGADLDYIVSENSFIGPSRYDWRSFSSQIGHETLFSLPLCSSSFVRSRVALTLGGNLYDGYTVDRAQVSFVATSAAISCALRQAAFIVDDPEDELLGTHALDTVNPSAPAGTPPYGNLLEVNGTSLPL
jgi:hypothetical protein